MINYKQLKDNLHEYTLQQLVFDDLGIIELNQILTQIYNIGYFEGRKDGERMWEIPTEMHLQIQNSLTENTSPKKNVSWNMRG